MAVGEATGGQPWILVVEDDHDLLRMLETMLSAIGRVTAVEDGMDALAVLDQGPVPDLVVTDLMMPRLDGLALSRHMKADPRTAGIPIIMLTARNRPRDVIEGINAGARHYITKPFKQKVLLDKVRMTLGRPAPSAGGPGDKPR